MLKRAVIYVRVSSADQVKNFSLDDQEKRCRERAEQLGFEVVMVFREEGKSAKNTDREELQKMLSCVSKKSNNIQGLFIYNISRLNRNTSDYLIIKALLAKHGVAIYSYTEPTGQNTPAGTLIETVLASFAQWTNENNAINISNGMKARFMLGYITSKPPVGYLMREVNDRKQAVKDPASFNFIKNLWLGVFKFHWSLGTVTKKLNDSSIKPNSRNPIKWHRQSVSKIFKNKFYMGVLEGKHGEVEGKHEPMIDEEIYWRVREIIEGRNLQKTRKRLTLNEKSPLKGLLKCPYDGRILSFSFNSQKQKGYYYCGSRKQHKIDSVNQTLAETKFIELLKTIKPTQTKILWLKEILKKIYISKYEMIVQSEREIQREIDNNEALKKTLRLKNLKGIFTDEEYQESKREIDIQILVQKGLLSEKKLQRLDIDEILNWMVFYISNLDRVWLDATPEGKLKLGSSIFPEKLIFENGAYRTPVLGRFYELIRSTVYPPLNFGDPDGIRTRVFSMRS